MMIAAAALVAGLLCGCGLYLLLSRNLQRMAIGFLLLSNGVNLFVLTSAGLSANAAPPIIGVDAHERVSADPLPQAFLLTAIVIGLGMAAFFVALAQSVYATSGRDALDENEDEPS